MTYLHAFAMCQSMFCAIPAFWQGWDEKAKNKILLFLPAVGLEMGLLWTGLAYLCRLLSLPALVSGMLMSAWPYVSTGFIHLDGFMDVTDAVKSWRDLDRRREILKDSHVGSFSVIGCILLMIAQFSFLASLPENTNLWIFTLIPVASRCCSALAVSCLKPMSTSQYAGNQLPPKYLAVLVLMLLATLTAGFFFCGKGGLALIGALAGFGLALLRACRSLQGMNGDISGFALTIGELAACAVLIFL